MPELPDVEAFRRELATRARGATIRRVEVADAQVLRNITSTELDRQLRGRHFTEPGRHGKWLYARTDGPAVLLHFGMTGSLHIADATESRHPHDRVVFVLDSGELRYRDQRKLRGLWLLPAGEAPETVTGRQGPDALESSAGEVLEHIGSVRRKLKSALLDQEVVAGLGNLTADETLWRARLHPGQRANSLDHGERDRFHRALRQVLHDSVRAGRVPDRNSWLTGHRDEAGDRCPRCGTSLVRETVSGRSTVWCPGCQQ